MMAATDESQRALVRSVLASLIESLEQDPEAKEESLIDMRSRTEGVTALPRNGGGGGANGDALTMLQQRLVARAEALYGQKGFHGIHEPPIFLDLWPNFSDRLHSGVFEATTEGPYVIGIGKGASTWSDVIYEIAHESLHLLDPVADVAVTPVAAIEEGVAVKFAEVVYSEHMRPHGAAQPMGSRAVAYDANYRSAYEAARKIPDEDLKRVRAHFGKFSAVTDTAAYRACVDAHVDDEEAQALAAPFVYRQLAKRA